MLTPLYLWTCAYKLGTDPLCLCDTVMLPHPILPFRTKKGMRKKERKRAGTENTVPACPGSSPPTTTPHPAHTQLMSNSHKCNPLCRIMFLFTFQECGVVRGVLIHVLVPFILTPSLSPSFSPLLTTLSSIKPQPSPPQLPSHPTMCLQMIFFYLKKRSWTI